jgi:hypothetical protein
MLCMEDSLKSSNLTLLLLCLIFSSSIMAGPREQAFVLHNRIAGVPPQKAVLDEMETLIAQGRKVDAARVAMRNPLFYNLVIKNWVKPWTNEEFNNKVPLNDYVATVIGVIRDDVSFDELLYGDFVYAASDDFYDNDSDDYSNESNRHYERLESQNRDLSTLLERRTQTDNSEITDVAGVLTSRASGNSFFNMGTNRAITRFTFINYLCRDFEDVHDINIPDYRIRRDVSRAPGGDSRVYRNKCAGCHAGQDALGGAFAYFDWNGRRLVHTPGQVANKINRNNNFNDGFVVEDDYWINLWSQGQNSSLGWRGIQEGNGINSFGKMISRTKAFSQCMAKKTFEQFCLKEVVTSEEQELVNKLANNFEVNGSYNMKDLIANTAVSCMGE